MSEYNINIYTYIETTVRLSNSYVHDDRATEVDPKIIREESQELLKKVSNPKFVRIQSGNISLSKQINSSRRMFTLSPLS